VPERFGAQVVLREIDDRGGIAGKESEVPECLFRCDAGSQRGAHFEPLIEGVALADHGWCKWPVSKCVAGRVQWSFRKRRIVGTLYQSLSFQRSPSCQNPGLNRIVFNTFYV
jgi:hypothetical protein